MTLLGKEGSGNKSIKATPKAKNLYFPLINRYTMLESMLNSFAEKGTVLNEAEIELLSGAFQERKFRKHQYLVQEGESARYLAYITKGLARHYLVDEKGQEHILLFLAEGWWGGDLGSFYTGEPSCYNIDFLEDTEAILITRAGLDTLFQQIPQLNAYFRSLYQNAIIAYNRRVSDVMSKSTGDRYRDFLSRYPKLDQRIPNHQIASFLGITPQSLSRIRRQAASNS
ncbi:MAG: Crp/Fnr family transcriptional regulator [Sphingobacteriales bacterium]|nr:MAG: Crp/Fnr family transcriptional regulator [Sphingobacteriales bacterium]